jgi:hypothetical protein
MSVAGAFITGTLIFAMAAGMVATSSTPLGFAFLACSVVCVICAFVNYLEGK